MSSKIALDARLDAQKRQYDAQAQRVDLGKGQWAYGASAFWPSLRAPYEFCENWLRTRDLKDKTVLDYGCGTGVGSVFSASLGACVTGVDISPVTIEVAKTRAERSAYPERLKFQVANCEALPFPDRTFDYVLSTGTLSCLKLDTALSELSRVIKPEGFVVVIDTLGDNPILNLNRRIKCWMGQKTEWSVDHILRHSDLTRFGEFFDRVETNFFDLTTLLFTPAGYRLEGLLRPGIQLARRFDQVIFAVPFLRRFSFKTVLILSGARKIPGFGNHTRDDSWIPAS